VSYFRSLFLEPEGCPIQKILSVVSKFSSVFIEEMNQSLLEEVSEEELSAALSSMQNRKSPGPDGFIVEFYKSFYDLLKEDLLLVVRESHREGTVFGPLNSTFLCLIPKKQDTESFEDFLPISRCNVIYKLISKVISRILRLILSEIIGEEQFGFLHNKKNHDAVVIAQEVLISSIQ
jgi:hypothetical protein